MSEPRDFRSLALLSIFSMSLIASVLYGVLSIDLIRTSSETRLTNAEVQSTLGTLYTEIRDTDVEIERVTEILRSDPNDGPALNSLQDLTEICLSARIEYNVLSADYGPDSLRGSTLPDEVIDVPPTDCR
jgi:hypothetical protein